MAEVSKQGYYYAVLNELERVFLLRELGQYLTLKATAKNLGIHYKTLLNRLTALEIDNDEIFRARAERLGRQTGKGHSVSMPYSS